MPNTSHNTANVNAPNVYDVDALRAKLARSIGQCKIAKENYFELAVFLMHYHSGQNSRGYRLLSRLRLSNLSSAAEHEAMESECYQYLVANYANRV